MVVSYLVSMIVDPASRQAVAQTVAQADWIGIPIHKDATVFGLFMNGADTGMLITACITSYLWPIATMMEHIGDICAISSTVERNYLVEPGLHRTLMGDGLATTFALSSGPRQTPPTARTPACWPCPGSMTPGSSAWPPSLP